MFPRRYMQVDALMGQGNITLDDLRRTNQVQKIAKISKDFKSLARATHTQLAMDNYKAVEFIIIKALRTQDLLFESYVVQQWPRKFFRGG